MTAPRLILTALATSGLRPNHDQPLELGLLAVDRETFEPVDVLTAVLKADPSAVLAELDPKVAAMHTENGLLEELVAGMADQTFAAAARAVSVEAVDFVERNGATGECRSPLICFGADWLHRWLLSHFPTLAQQFRGELDMSTVLNVQGLRRTHGNGRAESTLTELYAVLQSIRVKQIAA